MTRFFYGFLRVTTPPIRRGHALKGHLMKMEVPTINPQIPRQSFSGSRVNIGSNYETGQT